MSLHLDQLGPTCVVGLSWGDEGKGKIVDVLTESADVVVRYNGGANAGHTVVSGGDKFALHLIPCGALHDGKIGLLGPGVALDPIGLLDEIDGLRERGVDVAPQLRLSTRCHLVMPYHKLEDRLNEGALSGDQRIGTTARGIGPCYADKMQRSTAVRLCDLLRPQEFTDRVQRIVERKQAIFAALYDHHEPLDAASMAQAALAAGERLKPGICDTTEYLRTAHEQGKRLLFEGANGTLLDIDHGTYPYVTSSSSSAVGVPSGAGVPPAMLRTTIGVVKAYATRVGQGPFPTELHDATGDHIRERGREFGTTTGRPRRCGWFDAVATRYSVRLGGIDRLALMHLDTLSDLETIRVCTRYAYQGRDVQGYPAEADVLDAVEPVFESLPGWRQEIQSVRRFEDLPATAREYVHKIEQLVGANVSIVSVGPDRQDTIFR